MSAAVSGNPTPGPFALVAGAYRAAGWLGTLPLPVGQKKDPPAGYTGKIHYEVEPTDADVATWRASRGAGNIGLRMPHGVVGIDVDAYDGRQGAESLAADVERWGELPATWRVTSRDDGVSGIRFYRVPERLAWPNDAGPHIEMIHRGHRYAVTWPSLHPEGRIYRWIGPDGVTALNTIPHVADLPELPESWVVGLTGGVLASPATERAAAEQIDWDAAESDWLTAGECALVSRRVGDLIDGLRAGTGSRHDLARDRVLGILQMGQQGHGGVHEAMEEVAETFLDVVGADRGDVRAEWQRIIDGAVAIITADPWPHETCRGAACDGTLPSVPGLPLITTTRMALEAAGVVGVQDAVQVAPGTAIGALGTQQAGGGPGVVYADMSWALTGERPEIEPPAVLARTDGTPLFYAGRVNGVFGDPETAKSWLAMCAMAEALRAGQRASYLDVDHNGSVEIGVRLLALGVPGEVVGNPDLLRICLPDDAATLLAYVQEMVEWRPAVTVVDSLGEVIPMLGLSSTDNDDITRGLRAVLMPLAHLAGSCVIGIDHLPKSSDSRQSGYAIGGTAKKRAIDGAYLSAEALSTPAPGKVGRIRLTIEKDRHGGLRSTSVGNNAGVFVMDATDPENIVWSVTVTVLTEDGTVRRTSLMERLSLFLEGKQAGTVSANALEKEVEGKAPWLREALATLVAEGFVTETRTGPAVNSKRLLQSVRPYRQMRDPASDVWVGTLELAPDWTEPKEPEQVSTDDSEHVRDEVRPSSQVRPKFVPDELPPGTKVRPPRDPPEGGPEGRSAGRRC